MYYEFEQYSKEFKIFETSSVVTAPTTILQATFLLKRRISIILKKKLYQYYGIERFQRKGDSFISNGIHYFIEGSKKSIRFNWNENLGNKITSVDIFNGKNNIPSLRINTQRIPILVFIREIIYILSNDLSIEEAKKLLKTSISKPENNLMFETKFVMFDDVSNILESDDLQIEGLDNLVELGRDEKFIDEDADILENAVKNSEYADPDIIFEDLHSLLKMVISGQSASLLITGMPGVGKSYHVIKALRDANLQEDVEYVVYKGKTSPMGLYEVLYENKDKIIIFDDCDSVFSDEVSTNILKAALDTYDERVISWVSTKNKLPQKFTFTGGIIFISNLKASEINDAVKSRSFVIDVNLRAHDILNIMQSSLIDILPEISMNIKYDAFEYLAESVSSGKNVNINMRTLIKAIKIKASGISNWKRIVDTYCN